MFCPNCGQEVHDNAAICLHCGCALKGNQITGKSWSVSLLLCAFLGCIGAHRFYTGYTVIGIIQLLTAGGCGIWALIDFIFILCGNYKDSDGNLLVK